MKIMKTGRAYIKREAVYPCVYSDKEVAILQDKSNGRLFKVKAHEFRLWHEAVVFVPLWVGIYEIPEHGFFTTPPFRDSRAVATYVEGVENAHLRDCREFKLEQPLED